MARDLEAITLAYWEVRAAVHHPQAPSMSVEKALKKLLLSDRLRPTDWRLSALMHEVRYDIIEGSTKWREPEKRRAAGSISTLPMRD